MCQGRLAEAVPHGGKSLSRPAEAEQRWAESKTPQCGHFWDVEIQLHVKMQCKQKLLTGMLSSLRDQRSWTLKFPFKNLVKPKTVVRAQSGQAPQRVSVQACRLRWGLVWGNASLRRSL